MSVHCHYPQIDRSIHAHLILCVEAHCYIRTLCDNWQVDLDEHIHSRINQSIATDCRTFRPRRPSSTAYKTGLETN